jgi:hypothetical protein
LTLASVATLAWQRRGDSSVASGTTATLNGLTVEVHAVKWVEMGHVHDGQGGFLMPDQMMPGAPRGAQVRLGVAITLMNTDSTTQRFSLVDEFALVGGAEESPRPLKADSIGELPRLAPGATVRGTLYFDTLVPGGDDPPMYLRWSRVGGDVRIPLQPGASTEHEHG